MLCEIVVVLFSASGNDSEEGCVRVLEGTSTFGWSNQRSAPNSQPPQFPCREDNWPAVRLAHRLGFRELTTRVGQTVAVWHRHN